MAVDFPEDELEFGQAWSMKAGEVSGLAAGKSLAMTDAAWHYQEGRDEIARFMRDLGNRLKELHGKASKELGEYIREADQRRKLKP